MTPNSDLMRSELLARLLPVEAVAPVTLLPDALRSAPDFARGQKYQAMVEARLPNGNFKVLVNAHLLQINLPQSTRPGDTIKLVLFASEPRLKFVLLGDGLAGGGAALSTTGRFLGALAQDAATSPAATLTSAAPLLPGPPADSRQLPALLQQALSQSGVFYESHLAQWVAGKRTQLQLLSEPQAGLSAAAPPRPGTLMEALQSVLEPEPATLAAVAARNSDAPAHEQAVTLLQQQLSVLETGQLSWRGAIWPGQWLEWDIAEDPPAAGAADAPSRWQTRLRLTLPKLGEIAAHLALNSSGVHIALDAAAAVTAQLLQGGRQPLATAMTTAGLTVLAVEVRHDTGE